MSRLRRGPGAAIRHGMDAEAPAAVRPGAGNPGMRNAALPAGWPA